MKEGKEPFSSLRRTAGEVKRYRTYRRVIPVAIGAIVAFLSIAYVVSLLFNKYGSFTVSVLTAGVLSNLRQVTEYAAKHESRFVKLLVQQNEIGGKRKTAAAIKQLEQAQERISEISRIIKRLYEDNVNGKISDERFMELSADYEAEQAELKKRAAALQAELDKSQAATVNAEKFMGIVRKHLAFEELTPTLLREMIEKIVVHECSYDENGTRRQDIEIYYSFVGKIDLPE